MFPYLPHPCFSHVHYKKNWNGYSYIEEAKTLKNKDSDRFLKPGSALKMRNKHSTYDDFFIYFI